MLLINDHGEKNLISVENNEGLIGIVNINSSNNILKIGVGCRSHNMQITLGENCNISIGDHCNLGCLQIFALKNADITIGSYSSFTWTAQINCHEPSSIIIGNKFMCAGEVLITSSDMHGIFDLESGKRTNPAKDIIISGSVWLGAGVTILKGSIIGHDTIIGTRSVVVGAIPQNSVAAGNPARVVKKNVFWKIGLE